MNSSLRLFAYATFPLFLTIACTSPSGTTDAGAEGKNDGGGDDKEGGGGSKGKDGGSDAHEAKDTGDDGAEPGDDGGSVDTTFTAKTSVANDLHEVVTDAGKGDADAGDSGSSGQGIALLLTNNSAFTCAYAQSLMGEHVAFSNIEFLLLDVVSETTFAPGKYTIVPGTNDTMGAKPKAMAASAIFESFDKTCTRTADPIATSGTVTISSVDATAVKGSYDVTFGKGGTLSGTFDTSVCVIPDGGQSSTSDDGGATCVSL
jgi:hypothetical protein